MGLTRESERRRGIPQRRAAARWLIPSRGMTEADCAWFSAAAVHVSVVSRSVFRKIDPRHYKRGLHVKRQCQSLDGFDAHGTLSPFD